ncbi:hypothetical protein [Serratia sp. Tan611]|uniref:hypothetical protein n=1 Tax=Serratia sp. Tan611 TaxID=2773264 RepID=UPI001933ACA4|nr:hypothetical protein [Serratia sp. Tan611]
MKRTFLICTIAISVVGCAPKPTMNQSQYQQTATLLAAVRKCNEDGNMDRTVAALGLRYLSDTMNRSYTYDPNLLQTYVAEMTTRASTSPPTKAQCNDISLMIEDRTQQIRINNENVRMQQEQINQWNSQRPVTTYCNKVGTQTFCNSY